MTSELEEYLQHHGVLGMKWGVRKDRKALSKGAKPEKIKRGSKSIDVEFGEDALYKKRQSKLKRVSRMAIPDDTIIGNALNIAESIQNQRVKKHIVKALGGKTRDYNKSDLENAMRVANSFADFELVSNGKNFKFKDPRVTDKTRAEGQKVFMATKDLPAPKPKKKLEHNTQGEDFLQHHGILGMKWGVRRYQPYEKGANKPKGDFVGKTKKAIVESRAGQEVRSAKTHMKTMRTRANMDSMSTKDLATATKRLQMENALKSNLGTIPLTSKGRVSQRKEQKDYRNRGRMSDAELKRKVERVRAKAAFSQNADSSTKELKAVGKKVAQAAASLAITAVTKGGVRHVSVGDILAAAVSPSASTVSSFTSSMSEAKTNREPKKEKTTLERQKEEYQKTVKKHPPKQNTSNQDLGAMIKKADIDAMLNKPGGMTAEEKRRLINRKI